jgi:hypothetical protein
MKLSALNVNGVYAVVPSWGYNNSSARDVTKVRENDVVKATLVSLDKYDYQPSNRYPDTSRFSLAKQGERSVGVLMKADNNGSDYYWTARLADIVEEWSKLEPVWAQRNADETARQEEADRQRKIEQEIADKAERQVERLKQSLPKTIADIVGSRVGFIDVTTQGYGGNTRAVAIINLSDLETLIEYAYEGKAQVA